ncbi:hypothetical protein [Halomonas sp. BC04]|uniref:hypothetical protein n=1 Tax=Halomonas sp. BC04 TaxID=1403540 RepID=UPI0003ED7B5A|nr:hypothetical protein [Halomonas sp. BC04]EWH00594.1 hypothetical protein Q427_18665 [Halomonas sp. BC04]
MTPTDRYQLARAAQTGDARAMERASAALAAITQCLQDDGISPFCHDGLLTAIDIVAWNLGDRADFLNEILKEDADV